MWRWIFVKKKFKDIHLVLVVALQDLLRILALTYIVSWFTVTVAYVTAM